MRRPGLFMLPFALVAATVAVAGCGSDSSADDSSAPGTASSTPSTAPGTVKVALTEYAIKPSVATAPAGKVTFDVSNDGAIPHEFVVVKTGKQAGELLEGSEADETGDVGELDEKALGVKARGSLTLDLQAGHYALVCNLPGHYQGGMHTDFTVK